MKVKIPIEVFIEAAAKELGVTPMAMAKWRYRRRLPSKWQARLARGDYDFDIEALAKAYSSRTTNEASNEPSHD
jgi:hypothetical protein